MYYRCNKFKRRGDESNTSNYLRFYIQSEEIGSFWTEDKHCYQKQQTDKLLETTKRDYAALWFENDL